LKIKEIAKKQGRWDLRASGWRKVYQGITSVEEMLASTVVEM
jgi:type II secretory ATPase GspE/PulE/Tfp pilus assembly ATPase PilB-like protein